jgi:hypothetical protein
VPEEQELIDAEWRTLCDTLRGSIAMFDMLLAECGNSSETARVVGAARLRRAKVLEKIERHPATLTGAANFALVRLRSCTTRRLSAQSGQKVTAQTPC